MTMANLKPQSLMYLEAFKQMPPIASLEPQTVRDMFAMAPQ